MVYIDLRSVRDVLLEAVNALVAEITRWPK